MEASVGMKIVEVIVLIVYIAINLITAKRMSAKHMHDEFIEGQCMVGKICANIFYAPAWLLKGIRVLVLATIR